MLASFTSFVRSSVPLKNSHFSLKNSHISILAATSLAEGRHPLPTSGAPVNLVAAATGLQQVGSCQLLAIGQNKPKRRQLTETPPLSGVVVYNKNEIGTEMSVLRMDSSILTSRTSQPSPLVAACQAIGQRRLSVDTSLGVRSLRQARGLHSTSRCEDRHCGMCVQGCASVAGCGRQEGPCQTGYRSSARCQPTLSHFSARAMSTSRSALPLGAATARVADAHPASQPPSPTSTGISIFEAAAQPLVMNNPQGLRQEMEGPLPRDLPSPATTAAPVGASAATVVGSVTAAPAGLPAAGAGGGSMQAAVLSAVEKALGSRLSHAPMAPPGPPLVLVISGPSGVGKDAVIRRLQELRSELHFVITATTRPRREGEVDGQDYFFVRKQEFERMIVSGELLEHAVVYGDYKGIPKQQVRDLMKRGLDVVLRLDVQGAASVRKMLGSEAVHIFLVAESEVALARRLIERKTESMEKILLRVAAAREEASRMAEFDYMVVNRENRLDETVAAISAIIDSEKARVHPRKACL